MTWPRRLSSSRREALKTSIRSACSGSGAIAGGVRHMRAMKAGTLMMATIDPPIPSAQGASMRQLVCFLAALAVLAPAGAGAQMLPHRAEYALRLGTAANAPRIGSAVQDLTQDCG